MMRARILGTGSFLPPPSSPETRQAASVLAVAAAHEALAAAGSAPGDVDCLVLGTHTPDYYLPGTAPSVAAQLGLVGIPCLDIRNQCSGFLYGLSIADHFVRLGTYGRVLLVASESMAPGCALSTTDPANAILGRAGAAAAIVGPGSEEGAGILGAGLHADGRFARAIMVELPGSASDRPLDAAVLEGGGFPHTVGGFELLEESYRRLGEALDEGLATCRLAAGDVALFIVNHPVLPVARLLFRRLRLPVDRLYADLADEGNPGQVSLPLNLDRAARQGRIRRGDIVMLLGFGAGFTWGWTALRW